STPLFRSREHETALVPPRTGLVRAGHSPLARTPPAAFVLLTGPQITQHLGHRRRKPNRTLRANALGVPQHTPATPHALERLLDMGHVFPKVEGPPGKPQGFPDTDASSRDKQIERVVGTRRAGLAQEQ